SNGTLDWKYNTGRTGRNQYVRSSPAVVDGKVFFGCADGYVYCLYASNGLLDWDYYISGDGVYTSSPAIVDGKVFIGSYNGKVYCLYASTGIKIWESAYMDTYGYSSPAVADGKVYVGSYGDDSLYCLDASTGAWIWNYPAGGGVYSSPAVADGKIYFGSVDSNVYCLNTDGDKLWNYTTDDGVFSSPAIADGKVFIGSDDGNIYCLDTNGEELWIYTTDGSVRSCPAVADGKVFVGSWDGNVYCFGQPAIPDLDCDGSLSWTEVTPGETVTGTFTVENIGDPLSLLDWEIESYPDWGAFTFDPDGGLDLTPEAGAVTVTVEVVAPEDPEAEFEGEIVLVNSEDPDDTCVIDVALATPVSQQSLISLFFEMLAQRFPILGMILAAIF
ncbi:MAG: PQQ-binding-like beta-propeller repeat protein, partial [Candidatus Thermoplasmatota archaeon]|nr:PQQ-binding-like beta-propeller repeat protein [Candidatus Thermoplasmatota archaeon]